MMGKYDSMIEINYGNRMPQEDVDAARTNVLRCIGNELAEANRLKRLELEYTTFVDDQNDRIFLERGKDLEDRA